MNELYSLAQWLWQFNLLFSAQLLLILALRKPLLYWVGPLPAYRLWLLPLFLMPILWLQQSGLSGALLTGWLDGLSASSRGVVGGTLLPSLSSSLVASSLVNLPVMESAQFSWLVPAMGLWALGTLAIAGLHLSGMYRFAQRIRTSAHEPAHEYVAQLPLEEIFGRKLTVRLVDDMNSPALFGALRPILLLPVDFLQRYNKEQQRLILAHEAVHLRRHDNLLNLLLSTLQLAFWWNPLMHLAWRRYRMDQELSCDAQALALSASQQQLYARALLKTLSESSKDWSRQPTLSTWSQVRELKERTRMIGLNKLHRARRGLGTFTLGVFLLLGVASTLLTVELMPIVAPLQAADLAVPAQLPAPEPTAALARDDIESLHIGMGNQIAEIVVPPAPVAIDRYLGIEATHRDLEALSPAQVNAPQQLLAQLNSALDLPLPPEPGDIEMPQPLDPVVADLLPASDSSDIQDEQEPRTLRPIAIVEPEYPPRGLQRGIEGYATVEFTVSATGAVEDVRILESQPARVFDRSALTAASQLRFDPVLQDGKAVEVEGVRYKYSYKLVDDGPWVN